MPLERADAVVIGAGVEGISAALTLALSGKQVVCVDRRASLNQILSWDEAWVSPMDMDAAGLFQHGLRLKAPPPHLALQDGEWTVLWPDAERTARTLGGEDGEAFLEFSASLRRWRAALREPGVAARAMLASLDLVQTNSEIAELGRVLRSSAAELLDDCSICPRLKGLILAIAARRAPVSPLEIASAPMLLALAPYLDIGPSAMKPVVGGAGALIAALASAFQAGGGQLWLGREVSEIVMERETAAGVTFGAGMSLKSPAVIAAVAPKRLAQGLLSTRRYGRVLSGLRAPPQKTSAAMRVEFATETELPQARLGLWRSGASVWLGANEDNIAAAATAFRTRGLHRSPVLEIRFDPNLRSAVCVSHFCPPELSEGPWSDARRDELRDNMIAAFKAHWPQAYSVIEAAMLIWPREPETSGATGAIFGGANRMADVHELFGLGGDTPGALLKGVYLCAPRALDADSYAGAVTAVAAAGLTTARART